ncbi:MAG: NUDIX hydrolase [Desulfohalobiaceae bacterium]
MGRKYPQFPVLGIGALVLHQGQVLLVRRGTQPALGEWSIPGGMVELGESLQQAAEREILEETGVRIKAGEPAYVFDWIQRDQPGEVLYHYVIVDLWAEYLQGSPVAGDDAQEAGWVALSQLQGLDLNQSTRFLLQRLDFIQPGTYL